MRKLDGLASLALVSLAAACAGTPDPELAPSTYAQTLSQPNATAVIDLVNYPGTTAAVLDDAAGLDARAARGIVARRDGADGLSPSADDVLYTSLVEIDAVPYVGDAAFRALYAYAAAHPAPHAETVEGVAFAGWQSEAIVWGVNRATLADLDAVLDARAASALFAGRPYASVAAMGPVSYVGASALGALRDHAGAWWAAEHQTAPALAGTFDGVPFDEATATTALAIANGATQAQLTAHGITATAASRLVAGRPFATLGVVADTSGIGPATMSALKAYATSGTWGAMACSDAFGPAVQPFLDDLLFLSESDRAIELVRFPGAGTTAPTPASVLALVHEAAGSTAEQRETSRYFVAFEPSSDMADPSAAEAVEAAVGAQLTDVIYVAIFLPSTDPYHAEVRVYLVGRNACGDLVGLRSISVET